MNASSSLRHIIGVVGPTASGKSDLGIELALRFGGEIINCDSVQVYREIEIATAKVPLEARRGIPHHLIDVVSPRETYTAGQWARDAAKVIEEIEARGKLALLVGGSGFYLRALRQPLFHSHPTDEELRRRLIQIRERRGAEHLHKVLKRLDPESAERLAPRDWSRVQRAIEVRLQTGRTLSTLQKANPSPRSFSRRIRIFVLEPPRTELYKRIDRRAEQQFEAELVDEVRALMAKGVAPSSNALSAHGYRRVVEHLLGERTLESAIEQTKLDVRHYAKRQLTWFRKEPGVEWVKGFGDDPAVQERLFERLNEL